MTPPFPPEEPLTYLPGAHIQGYPTSGPNARAVPLIEHLTIVRRLEAERDAAVADLDALLHLLCSALVHDAAKHGGRLSGSNVVRAMCGDAMPWAVVA